MSGFGWAALALLFGYLALFFWGSALAAQAAGRPVWLFARALVGSVRGAVSVANDVAGGKLDGHIPFAWISA